MFAKHLLMSERDPLVTAPQNDKTPAFAGALPAPDLLWAILGSKEQGGVI
jgi:hypothetical protein